MQDYKLQEIGHQIFERYNIPGYLELKEVKEIRRDALNKVKWQNKLLEPKYYEGETHVYSTYLKDEETDEVKYYGFRADKKYNTKQYFVILLNDRYPYLTKQQLKKEINNI